MMVACGTHTPKGMAKTRYEGGCHCGAVRFAVTVDALDVIDCNCSICSKKGFLHLIVATEDFELLHGEGSLVEYRFNTGTAVHRFCGTCGIHPFYTPRSHPDRIDVNVRCFDDDVIDRCTVRSFDGRNWERNIGSLRAEEENAR